MSSALKEKVAIVTGASKGIGRELALGLAREGADIAVLFKNDDSGAEATCDSIRDLGRRAVPFGADVGKPDETKSAVRAAHEEFGRIDILVNNAGRTRFGPANRVTEEDWDDVMNTNLRGAFFTSVAAAEVMEPGSSIINISSIAASLMVPFHAVYTTSKGGVEAMTRQLALELAPAVRVNAIAPAATSMERNWEYDPDFDRSWTEVTPLGRVAKPRDFVGPVVFLASHFAGFITGDVLHVDGGWTIKGDAPRMDHYDFDVDQHRG